MKSNLMFILTTLLFICNLKAQTWEEIGFNLPDGQIASANSKITFANKDTGWLYNEFYAEGIWHKQLYRTTDGGENWQRVTLNNVKNTSGAIIFSMEPDFFYMINSDYYVEYPSDVLFTRDGGNTWTYKQIVNDSFKAIHFFDEEKGVIVGGHNWLTNDGGLTWLRGGAIIPPEDIHFHNEYLGWAVGVISPFGTDAGYIANTTDGGNSWTYQDSGFGGWVDYSGIDFLDSLKGFAVGGSVSKTIDGGNNWETIPGVNGYDVGFLDDKNGWISTVGDIFYTSDGGQTWAPQLDSLMHYYFIKIIILKNDKVAYILGKSSINNTATLLKADLNNISGVEENSETKPNEFHLWQNYPNPFNPTTVINFSLPQETHVTLKVYDILGQEVAVLVNELKPAGEHKALFNAKELPSGVYIYTVKAGTYSSVKKMLLVK